jgi:hypothetical protein
MMDEHERYLAKPRISPLGSVNAAVFPAVARATDEVGTIGLGNTRRRSIRASWFP